HRLEGAIDVGVVVVVEAEEALLAGVTHPLHEQVTLRVARVPGLREAKDPDAPVLERGEMRFDPVLLAVEPDPEFQGIELGIEHGFDRERRVRIHHSGTARPVAGWHQDGDSHLGFLAMPTVSGPSWKASTISSPACSKSAFMPSPQILQQ